EIRIKRRIGSMRTRLLLAILVAALSAWPAQAAHWSIGIGIGLPLFRPCWGPCYYPAPVYVAPAPVYVAPAPVYVAPAPAPTVTARPLQPVPDVPPPPAPAPTVRAASATKVDMGDLNDSSEKVRLETIAGLGRRRDRRAIAPLSRILADEPNPKVRDAAARALGQIGGAEVLPALQRAA